MMNRYAIMNESEDTDAKFVFINIRSDYWLYLFLFEKYQQTHNSGLYIPKRMLKFHR